MIPPPIDGPGTGAVVGVDRGVAVSAALSTGEPSSVPGLRETEAERQGRLQRRLARAAQGSNRRKRAKIAIARLKARQTNRRKDWVEKTSTDLARRFDLIRLEDLKIGDMVRSARGTIAAPGVNVRAKAGLNRSIHAAGWGRLATRLEHEAACGHTDHADVNAAKNIAAGRAVTCLPRPTDPDRPPLRGALQP
ncbi:RNA-guided endonuclease InsQ/TnpB family protein [Actinoallomurus iriomotensis]|uniref:Probable transposase IS891/IS1136/IS1341 domain-containing protein n=1 Tax=Actinoallomurus iriomotensis TaxID=478107 RepID=A0A9W6VRP0_9ACTN|nr:transposase [Actinoallomurus iriomotensis]GLY75816.1 hypothetical protein Airi01_040830 [Actinoallomurus iriomotensis]